MRINVGGGELRELKPRILVIGVGGAGGNAINDPRSLLMQVENAKIGKPFELEVFRINKEINLSIKPAALPGIS